MAANKRVLGVDIGGTKCAVSIGTPDGQLVDREELGTDQSAEPAKVLDDLQRIASALLVKHKLTLESLLGVGVSCGGPLDTSTGTILRPPNLPRWEAVPVRAILEEAFPDVRVVLENDANATAVAEWRWGAGVGFQNIVYLTLGTGIGGGIILDGKLYRGHSDLAGEVGHQTILMNGPICGCGKRGCLEALASGPAVARLARESLNYGRGRALLAAAGGRAADITAKHVIECAKRGDALSMGVLNEVGTYLGLGLANIVQILNPQRIILGTLAIHAGELLLSPVREALSEYAWARSLEGCKVVAAGLGERAQDLAAISLVDADSA